MSLITSNCFLPKVTHMPCCGENNVHLTGIISTDTAYGTFHKNYLLLNKLKYNYFRFVYLWWVADVLSPSTEHNFWAYVLETSEIQREFTAHCSALWEDSRNRWYLYTQVLCTEYKHKHEMMNRNVLCMEFTYLLSPELHRLVKWKYYFHFSYILMLKEVNFKELIMQLSA